MFKLHVLKTFCALKQCASKVTGTKVSDLTTSLQSIDIWLHIDEMGGGVNFITFVSKFGPVLIFIKLDNHIFVDSCLQNLVAYNM